MLVGVHGMRINNNFRRMAKNIGSIYRVEVDSGTVRYFWDVATDSTQLGGAIIVLFRRSYPKDSVPDLDEIISDDVDFYCHTMPLVGKKLGLWEKVGFRPVTRTFQMMFRASDDIGNPAIKVSERWYIWEPSQPMRFVGKLTPEYAKIEEGAIYAPIRVVNRIRTGVYYK